MLVGIGTDLIEIDRIRRAITRNERFLARVFTEEERIFFEARDMEAATIAANFAGKEAVLKVLGTGISGMSWKDIEVLRQSSGKPFIRLSGRAAAQAEQLGMGEILISLSHSKSHALAFAIGQRR
ncbi:holo-ACP synthase [Acidaminobacter hydrogenoformans]|uniref:Holo-[acyl-carrier-protein] synthase n=1 Tax=Acidaminobacter hydrogenoformans DSM 2784 TaxID=1120920 RepID=A0A1G5S340_9FIRM|nr:holo-ACP synthase [Acidaminobacter hydrogenoformans]SCZ80795.1 holo-[acyl-carrier-protein] synthase [Acidaminobacter hydrogenoformans DSM 2784]